MLRAYVGRVNSLFREGKNQVTEALQQGVTQVMNRV
jgi:hypothetical protein